jgi:hypothetical protein
LSLKLKIEKKVERNKINNKKKNQINNKNKKNVG